jgi:hypothetical protein
MDFTINLLTSNRKFKLWDYDVSHRQLLLRSPKSEKFDTNLDIIFLDVSYCNIPTSLAGLALAEPTEEELFNIEKLLLEKPDPDTDTAFWI